MIRIPVNPTHTQQIYFKIRVSITGSVFRILNELITPKMEHKTTTPSCCIR